jgi:hypothetical protein
MYYHGDHYAWFGAFAGAYGLVLLIVGILFVVCYWKIFAKAGYPGILALLAFVPVLNLIVLIWFAFADWPVLKRARGEPTD